MVANSHRKVSTNVPHLTLLFIILLCVSALFYLSWMSSRDYFNYQEAIAQTPVQNATENGRDGGGMSVYQNTTYGIRMEYPPDWQIAQFNNSAAAPVKLVAGFLSPVGVQRVTDRTPENVLVGIENLSSRNMGLAPYTTLQLSLLSEGTQGF